MVHMYCMAKFDKHTLALIYIFCTCMYTAGAGPCATVQNSMYCTSYILLKPAFSNLAINPRMFAFCIPLNEHEYNVAGQTFFDQLWIRHFKTFG